MAPAVNHPVEPEHKEKDINTKLQLYGIFKAFSNGKLPSNKQCDIALNSALSSRCLLSPPKELSEEGRSLVQDLRNVIQQAKLLLLMKNEGNLLQEFIWEAQHLSPPDVGRLDGPVDKEAARQDATRALDGFRTFGTLLITNGEFRKLLSDATVLFRDIAGDVTQKASTRIRPSEEELSQIGSPAEGNVWHEKPAMSKEDIKSKFRAQAERYQPVDSRDVDEAANAATQAAVGDRESTSAFDLDLRVGGAAATERLKESASQNIPEDTKSRTSEISQRTRDFLSQKVPQERRDQAIFRLKKMITEIQGHSDYQQAIETLLSLAERYGSQVKNLSQHSAGAVRGARTDERIRATQNDLKILIERFANYTSLDDFFDALNDIYRDAEQDPTLKGWFKHVNIFIRKCLREQGYIMQEDSSREWNDLYDQGRYLMRERYRTHADRIVDEIKFIAAQFDEDAQSKTFKRSVEKLFKDLGQDENGKPKFKKHLLKDITNVILPTIFDNIRYVPIPRIEVSDPTMDVVVENLVIESDNLMPNVVELGTDNYWRWGRKNISNKNDHRVMISASGIQADMRDVSYYIRKKQGFLTMSDIGLLDIFLGGQGFSFKISASTPLSTQRQRFFKVDKISVHIHNLDIRLKRSGHKILFNLFKPVLFGVVRPVVEKVIERQIRDLFERADGFAYEVYIEAKRARKAMRQDPNNAPSTYSQYTNALRKVLTERKEKTKAAAQQSDTKVQVAVTHREALFKELKLPGDVTNKATRYDDLAAKGERWESSIFDIGDASPSRDLPETNPISRKPHTTTSRGGGSPKGRGNVETNGRPVSSELQPFCDGANNTTDFSRQLDQALGTDGSIIPEAPTPVNTNTGYIPYSDSP